MRKVEYLACRSFADNRQFRCGNTRIERTDDGAIMYLHGHIVARVCRADGTLVISDAGWQTVTTKSRLNAVLATFFGPGAYVYQQDWQWYLVLSGSTYRWTGGATINLGSATPACVLERAS